MSVLIHPVAPAGFAAVSLGRLAHLIEFPMDTARTIVDAIYAGLFLRFPEMRMILSHNGGALPMLADRITALGAAPWVANPKSLTPVELRAQMSSLYFDTALAGTAATLFPTIELGGADHLLYGSDYPPAGIEAIEANMEALNVGGKHASSNLDMINETSLRLFPAATQRALSVQEPARRLLPLRD